MATDPAPAPVPAAPTAAGAPWPPGRRGEPVLHSVLAGVAPAEVAEAIAVHTTDMMAALDADLRFVVVNPSVEQLTGWAPEEVLGRNSLELLHPDDAARGEMVAQLAASGTPPGGSATFRLRMADGSYLPCQVAGGVVEVGGHPLVTIVARVNFVSDAVDGILDGLLHGRPPAQVFPAIAEYVAWRENGSHVAIAWWDGGEAHAWDTGLPDALTGRTAPEGSVWHRCRTTGTGAHTSDLADLLPDEQVAAARLGLCSLWVEPVVDPHRGVVALVSIWTTRPGFEARTHTLGMTTAVRYVELTLRWYAQIEALATAANTDALTGLANRRAFYAAIDGDGDRRRRGGAVLYCDLDGFKPVNDTLGHASGDAVLQVVADRLRSVVRDGDLVARLGGDEFALVLWDADRGAAEAAADRIRATFQEPIALADATVTVGITVGVAHDPDAVDEAVVDAADRALYSLKHSPDRRRPGTDRLA